MRGTTRLPPLYLFLLSLSLVLELFVFPPAILSPPRLVPDNWQESGRFVFGSAPSSGIKIRPVSRDVDAFSEARVGPALAGIGAAPAQVKEGERAQCGRRRLGVAREWQGDPAEDQPILM